MTLSETLTSLGHPLHIVVTGGRNYTDSARIEWAIKGLHEKYGIARLAHGAARGADTIAGYIAYGDGILVLEYSVDTAIDGPWPAAGHRRNLRMLEEEHFDETKVDLVVAFPGGRGTAGCAKMAEEMHIPVWRVQAK